MKEGELHDWAEAAVQTTLARCVRGLIAELDRGGRANMRVPALRVEGRAQIAMAEQIREEAKKAGLA